MNRNLAIRDDKFLGGGAVKKSVKSCVWEWEWKTEALPCWSPSLNAICTKCVLGQCPDVSYSCPMLNHRKKLLRILKYFLIYDMHYVSKERINFQNQFFSGKTET
jgi:hypothetical protein